MTFYKKRSACSRGWPIIPLPFLQGRALVGNHVKWPDYHELTYTFMYMFIIVHALPKTLVHMHQVQGVYKEIGNEYLGKVERSRVMSIKLPVHVYTFPFLFPSIFPLHVHVISIFPPRNLPARPFNIFPSPSCLHIPSRCASKG